LHPIIREKIPEIARIAACTIDGAEALVAEGFYVRDLEGLKI